MKIAIDGRVLVNKPTGIANYIIHLVNSINSACPEIELVLLAHKKMDCEVYNKIAKSEKIRFVICKNSFFNKSIIWYIFSLPFMLQKIKPDFFWAPDHVLPPFIPQKITTIVTVHDMVSKQFRGTMRFYHKIYNDLFFDKSINNADMLLAVSNYTKGEIEKNYPARKAKKILVGESINKNVFKIIPVGNADKHFLKKKYDLAEKFILFVGTIEPRKNLVFLLSLLPEIVRCGFDLLVVGAKGWGKTGIERVLQSDGFPSEHVKFAGFVSDEELTVIYNCAYILVVPSLNEGFGLPALEAMSCGCPVVAANNSALSEVVGGGGCLIDGWEHLDWIEGIMEVDVNRSDYVRMGLKKSKRYDWDEIANNILNDISNFRRPFTDA